MKTLKKISVAILTLTLFACSNDDTATEENPNPTTDIYVAGNVIDQKAIAVYWKNGEMIELTGDWAQPDAYAKAIKVVGQDVYVAGEQMDGQQNFKAVIWKNGIATNLNTPTGESARVTCMAVDNHDVYVGGILQRNNQTVAVYWKNNEPVKEFPNGSNDGTARDIAVVNNIVHVVGNRIVDGNQVAMYWRDGYANGITNSPGYNIAYGISITSNNEAYIALGQTLPQANRTANYWTNGQIFPLSDGSRSEIAKSITVINNDIFVAGEHYESTTGKRAIKYWKNSEPTILHESTALSTTNAMGVSDNKVYIVGFLETAGQRLPTLWSDTQTTNLSTLPGNAEDIFIVKN